MVARRRERRRGEDAAPHPWHLIWAVVAQIPRGRVATYGQVAALAGLPRRARLAGYALHGLPADSDLPWHRVINAQGRVSERSEPGPAAALQRHLLEEEGVTFDATGRVDLRRFRWDPDAPQAPRRRRPRARLSPPSRCP